MLDSAASAAPRALRILTTWAVVPILAAAFGTAAQAGPFKQNMQRMGQTTKAAKAELGAFDAGHAAALLQQYVDEAREGESLSGGDGSAKAKDLRARFARLASTAQASASSVGNAGQFRKAFLDIATQCKSCHSAYK